MKVAFILNSFPALSETFILAQIVGLMERGHEVDIYADRPEPPPQKLHANIERLGLIQRTHYRVPPPKGKLDRVQSAVARIIRRGWRHPRAVLDSLNVARHGRAALNLSLVHEWFPDQPVNQIYDIIHCHFGPNGSRALAMRKAGALRGAIVTTFHGYDANVLPRVHGADYYAELFQYGDLFTVGSEFMRQRVISLGAPRDRIAKLPMGVDLARFRLVEGQRSPDDIFRLLTVARLAEVKGIEYALRGVAMVKRKYPHLRYKIAGDGPLRGMLEQLAAKLAITQVVEFLGAVSQEEGTRLYASADAFILPSIVTESGEEENQPVVLAEAQACGLPVIATSIGGIAESMLNGKSGLLVPQRDPQALASAILQIANHPETRGRMGHAGRAFVEERFDLEKLNNQLIEIYRRATKGDYKARVAHHHYRECEPKESRCYK